MISENKLKNIIPKEKIYAIVSVIIALSLIFGSVLPKSYAAEDSSVEWQLLYIKKDACGPKDNMDKVYASLTTKYFELYQLANHNSLVDCISESQFKDFKKSENVNLLILIFDKALGKSVLQPNNLDGIYVHSGDDRTTNHLLMMCDCSDFASGYETTLPSWILSHELSHFVLSYKGFSKSDVKMKVHELQDGYDKCVGTNFGDDKCNEFKITLRADSSTKDYVMMAPYVPAVGNNLITYIAPDTANPELISLQRDLTKMWITNAIDDKAYETTLRHLVSPVVNSTSEDAKLALEFPNGFMIRELSKPTDTDWKQYLEPIADKEKSFQTLLNYVPFNLKDPVSEPNIEKMPNWFKTRALLWSEKRISDKVFFDGVEHLVRMGILKVD
jgi:hypothetical protein